MRLDPSLVCAAKNSSASTMPTPLSCEGVIGSPQGRLHTTPYGEDATSLEAQPLAGFKTISSLEFIPNTRCCSLEWIQDDC
jgi:hypothetical protein